LSGQRRQGTEALIETIQLRQSICKPRLNGLGRQAFKLLKFIRKTLQSLNFSADLKSGLSDGFRRRDRGFHVVRGVVNNPAKSPSATKDIA
jgi:hypothetical protein